MEQTLTEIIQTLATNTPHMKILNSDYDRKPKLPKIKKVTPLKKNFTIYNPIPKKNNFFIYKKFASPKKNKEYANSSQLTILTPEDSLLNFISPKTEKEDDNIFSNINTSLYFNFENKYVKKTKNNQPKFKKINFEKIKNYKQQKNENKILLPHKTSLNSYKPPGCNCKNSKCLKLYCKCFQSGKGCVDCNCVGCENIENSKTRNDAIKKTNILNPKSKNKKIEAHKIFSIKENTVKYRLTLSSGCNCKNSKCQKKYCECFQYGLNCSPKCKCQNCLNDKIKNIIYDNDPITTTLAKRNFTNIKEELKKKLLMIKRVKFNIN